MLLKRSAHLGVGFSNPSITISQTNRAVSVTCLSCRKSNTFPSENIPSENHSIITKWETLGFKLNMNLKSKVIPCSTHLTRCGYCLNVILNRYILVSWVFFCKNMFLFSSRRCTVRWTLVLLGHLLLPTLHSEILELPHDEPEQKLGEKCRMEHNVAQSKEPYNGSRT